MMEWGLRGPTLARRRALGMRVGAIALFLTSWALVAGVVEALGLIAQERLPRLRERAGAKRPEDFRHGGATIESDRSARLHAVFT